MKENNKPIDPLNKGGDCDNNSNPPDCCDYTWRVIRELRRKRAIRRERLADFDPVKTFVWPP